MKTTHLVVGMVLALSTVSTAAQSAAAFTGNMSATNNYIWRGVTQTTDQAAIQGGLDYDFGNNFTLGAWTSNAGASGTELDIYGAYKFNLGKDKSIDAGVIHYAYPSVNNADFTEIFGKFSLDKLVLGAYYTVAKDIIPGHADKKNDIYLTAGYSIDLGKDKSLGLTVGNYSYDDPAIKDYSHFRVAFSKAEFTAAIDKTDQTGHAGDPRFTVTYTKSFDL
ncbi:MAG: hypothetical protein HY080_04530 [Gammaproteobacteria bacterium]|nr:hypothetical protein [Gammaproteobacteria bacterium]